LGAVKREFAALLKLAAPLAATQAGLQLMGVVDVAVLGRYGARELAASGIGNAVFFAFSLFGIGIILGIDPIISQAMGANDPVRARRALWHGVWLACFVTAALTVILLACVWALPVIGTPELIAPARIYLAIRIFSMLPMLLFVAGRAYLQALSITRPMVIATIVANILNVIGDIAFVFGVGPIPPMGVAGAAIATLICSVGQVAILAYFIRRVPVEGTVDRSFSRADVMRAFRVGLPVGLHMGAEVGVFALVALLAGRLGTLQIAAHQIVISIASFTFTVAVGVATAGSVRVGIGVGARDPEATRLSGRVTFVAASIVMGTSGICFALFPRAIAHLITDQQDIIRASVPLMIVAAVFQLSDGVQAAGAGVLRGAGDTHFVFYVNVLGHWLIGLPVALYLGFVQKMGVVGLWWGLSLGLTIVAVFLFFRFERLSRGVITPLHEPT
jgi:MATE family multidrug resistance protein